jgi:hypothetical protein
MAENKYVEFLNKYIYLLMDGVQTKYKEAREARKRRDSETEREELTAARGLHMALEALVWAGIGDVVSEKNEGELIAYNEGMGYCLTYAHETGLYADDDEGVTGED